MKKLLGMLCCALLLLAALPGASEAQIRFGFKGYGGLNYLSGGDLNKGAQGFSKFALGLLDGASPKGEYSPLHLGMNFGGEFLLQFSPSMGVGLGVGYIAASRSDEITYTAASTVEFTWAPKVSAIPITASFYYFLPSNSPFKVFFNLGAGYYLAKTDFDYGWCFIFPIHWAAKTTGGGLGFHGGLGFEYAFSPMASLFAEIKGRFAAFNNFEGSVVWTFPGIPISPDTEEGSLWAFDDDFGSGIGKQTWLWISESEPAGDNVRKAKVDFSGFSFVIGFIVRFGS